MFKTGYKTAVVNVKVKFIHVVNGDGSKAANNHQKGSINHNKIDIQAAVIVVSYCLL